MGLIGLKIDMAAISPPEPFALLKFNGVSGGDSDFRVVLVTCIPCWPCVFGMLLIFMVNHSEAT